MILRVWNFLIRAHDSQLPQLPDFEMKHYKFIYYLFLFTTVVELGNQTSNFIIIIELNSLNIKKKKKVKLALAKFT